MTSDPLPSLHKLLTAAEEHKPVFLNAGEVAELSEEILSRRFASQIIWNEHQAMCAALEAPLAVKH